MIRVRRHKRKVASGRTVTVRAHEREGGDGTVPVPEWSRPARAADLRQEAPQPDGDWWDDEMADHGPECPVNWRQQQRDRDPALASACAACGHDGTPGDPLTLTSGGSRVHRSHTTDPASGFYGEEAAGSLTLADAKRRLREAREALEANAEREEAAGIDYETDEFRRLNDEVGAAMQDVPWYRDEPREVRDRFRYRREDRDDAADAVANEGMSPAFAAMVRQNSSLGGESYRKLKALRDSGYTGPVDQDGNRVVADTGISVVPEEPLPEASEW